MTMTASSIFALNNHHIISPSSGYAGPVATSGSSADGNSKTVNGTVNDMTNGFGSFSKTMEEVNGTKTVDKTVIFANGKSKSSEKSVTINDDGSKTITKTGKNGKTSTIQEQIASNNGVNTVTKEKTNAKGVVTKSTSTVTKNDDGSVDHQITRTNAQNETETLDREVTKANGTRSVVTNGTGYNGKAIYNETTWTTTV